MKNIIIKYKDSCIVAEQTAEIAKIIIITAIGFLIKEDDEHIVLAQEIIDNEYRGQIAIPKCSIEEKLELLPKERYNVLDINLGATATGGQAIDCEYQDEGLKCEHQWKKYFNTNTCWKWLLCVKCGKTKDKIKEIACTESAGDEGDYSNYDD